ncbi:hypothetical protein B0H17DRAFT_1092793 [Mycena rosella]|uniref:Uncharacterized protein n=1 Tax=Mycena rosella TaxID=1033263 RepID=A0AAD7CU66_MYCRO|nr:hypothetical protein B0H17DRAFT_1092793 [Mycena rosella]
MIHSLPRRSTRTKRPQRHCEFSVSLPLEIELLILDEFVDDTVRLRRFCRICRAWGAHAQSLLFRDVCVRYRTAAPFLALLKTGDVGRHISTLSVIEGSHWERVYDQPSLLDAIAPLLAKTMPNVRTLLISYRSFVRLAQLPPETHWGGISRLQVRFCKFADSDTLVAFIASFPRLESLDVFQCCTQDVRLGAKPAPLRSPIVMPGWHLKYLALGEFPQNALLDWMVAAPTEITVDHLRILSLGPDASSFNALLAKIGEGLRELEVPGMHRWVLGPEVPLSICPCVALTTLTFSERSAYDLGRGIISVLAQVAAPRLATVAFQIHLNTGFLDIPWEEVGGALSTDAFRGLEAAAFSIWGGPFEDALLTRYDEAVLLMAERLPRLAARGLLHFSYAEDTTRTVYVPPAQEEEPLRESLRTRISRRVSGWLTRPRRTAVYTIDL